MAHTSKKYVFLRNWRSRRARCRDEDCAANHDVASLIRDAQVTQSAQAGYSCDYIMKRQALAVQEAKEWQKSQVELAHELRDKPVGYAMSRVSKRLATDCYARGVCRGSVECANLIDQHTRHPLDPTRAESIKTAPVQDMSLAYPLALLKLPTRAIRSLSNGARSYQMRGTLAPMPTTGVSLALTGPSTGSAGKMPECSSFPLMRLPGTTTTRWRASVDPGAGCHRPANAPRPAHAGGEEEVAGRVRQRQDLAGHRLPHSRVWRGRLDSAGHGLSGHNHIDTTGCWCRATDRTSPCYLAQAAVAPKRSRPRRSSLSLFPGPPTRKMPRTSSPYIGDLRPPGIESWREALRTRVLGRGFPTEEVRRYVLGFLLRLLPAPRAPAGWGPCGELRQ